MGFFGFVGKALGGIAKGVFGVAKVGLGVAGKLGVGGPFVGLANQVLNAKRSGPSGSLAIKLPAFGRFPAHSVPVGPQRGNQTQMAPAWGAPVLRASPVMPGGGIATPRGVQAFAGGAPPVAYGSGRTSPGPKRRRKKIRAIARKGRRRLRRLKFGSPAWRKKYMKKRRR